MTRSQLQERGRDDMLPAHGDTAAQDGGQAKPGAYLGPGHNVAPVGLACGTQRRPPTRWRFAAVVSTLICVVCRTCRFHAHPRGGDKVPHRQLSTLPSVRADALRLAAGPYSRRNPQHILAPLTSLDEAACGARFTARLGGGKSPGVVARVRPGIRRSRRSREVLHQRADLPALRAARTRRLSGPEGTSQDLFCGKPRVRKTNHQKGSLVTAANAARVRWQSVAAEVVAGRIMRAARPSRHRGEHQGQQGSGRRGRRGP